MSTSPLRVIWLLLAPFLLLLAIEGLFHTELWEGQAQPASHAGTSVQLKRALRDPLAQQLDWVTLGSSRPEYGIDHAAWARRAHEHGLVHANLSMPGTHWMTIEVLRRWLARTHPHVRGAVIAMSIQDFTWVGNSSYELSIVQPFRNLGDTAWIAQHVPFDLHDPATWGTYSAMAQWRDDIRQWLTNPMARADSIAWARTNLTPARTLFENPAAHEDICRHHITALSACEHLTQADDDTSRMLLRQCRELRTLADQRLDFTAMLGGAAIPPQIARARELVRAQLRHVTWPEPPIVVLMPVPSLWQREVLGPGMHQWALAVLQPLVDEGSIRLFDATDVLTTGADECRNYFDFYHQSPRGRDVLDAWLEPRLSPLLYGKSPAHPTAPRQSGTQ